MRVVASDHAQRRLAGLILFRPHQVPAARRPRTEARPRRKDPRKWKHGIDKPRPVTQARTEPSEMQDHRPETRSPSTRATTATTTELTLDYVTGSHWHEPTS